MGLLDLFRSKPAPTLRTFNERVTLFWQWFQQVSLRFYQTIEAGKCSALADETSSKVEELLQGFCWAFGPGANGHGHSFTLTGDGNIHRQLLALHWLSRAPAVPGWTFYAARQPGTIKGHVIEMAGISFDPKEIWVTPVIDEQEEKLDVTVWHPAWEQIEERQQHTVTFLFLDEALGEYGTDWWIGKIKFGKDKLNGSFPLEELAEYMATTAREKGWKKHLPGEHWTLYQTEPRAGDFPRADIVTQMTCVPRLFTDFMNATGTLEDPLSGTGADYIYVSIASEFFPKGEETSTRGKIEDAVDAALKKVGGGQCIGGAFGVERSYCDFLIFDGKRSLAAVRDALGSCHVPVGTMIEFFAHEKRAQRIAL
jgi:hypothetical protein